MRRALIVGGSLGGLFAANMLHRAGWDVLVLERVGTALSGRGAGIVTHPELFDCLRQGGVTVDDTIGVAVPGRVTLAQDGSVAMASDLPQILTAWGRLYHLLKDALPAQCYRFGAGVVAVEQDAARVTARLADGASETGDLLVGADGFRSAVRAQFLPQSQLDYAGYVAWRGLTDEAVLSSATHAAVFDKYLRYQMLALSYRGDIAAREHAALLDCALARDASAAGDVLNRHVSGGVEHALATGTLG